MADASKILLTEGDAPDTPAAGICAAYTKTDHLVYTKGDDGVEHAMGTGTVDTSGTPVANDIARFTDGDTIEGLSYAEFCAALDLEAGTDFPSLTTFNDHNDRHAVGGDDSVFPADPGADKYLMWDDDPGELVWATPAGSGDVTAAANMTDNTIVRGDGGAKGVQDTEIAIDDSDNITGVTSILVEGNVNLFDAGGEHISGDGTDLTIASGAKINLTATSDVIVPVNVGVILGDGAEKIESDNTDLTINSGGDINLTATTDINVPANVGMTFGDDGEKIEGDGTDLTINSSAKLNLSATSDVIIPVNVGLILGDGAEKIESDNTDLTINSGGDINLTATADVNIPASVGVTFGDDGEKIEGDGTDLTIASSGVLNLNSTGALNASHQAITDNHVLTVDDAAAADDDFARFTANGIEGLTVAEAITALLGAALPENVALVLDAALSADGKYSGIVETGTAGTTLAFGDIVYYAVADSRWELAKADAAATSFGKIGICVQAAAADGSATTVLLWGKVRADTAFPALTIGAPVFISAATAGDITSTAPTGTTNFVVRIVGYGNTADELFFCPDKTYLELA